ncbi:MAG: hypothetical protein K0Q74_954 [Gammaproteobacteria bacterium]|jgi:hypothetical protein|nr:hypothetical protein [Gammaproteobacteria bacterium]
MDWLLTRHSGKLVVMSIILAGTIIAVLPPVAAALSTSTMSVVAIGGLLELGSCCLIYLDEREYRRQQHELNLKQANKLDWQDALAAQQNFKEVASSAADLAAEVPVKQSEKKKIEAELSQLKKENEAQAKEIEELKKFKTEFFQQNNSAPNAKIEAGNNVDFGTKIINNVNNITNHFHSALPLKPGG